MKIALFLAGTALPLLAALPGAAATCAINGLAVTCDGAVTGGFTNAAAGLQVTVTAGATVSRANGDAIRVRGNGVTVANDGTISGLDPAGSDGVDGGQALTVINTGTITATNKGVDAEEKDGLTIRNSGTIRAQDKAIRNADGKSALLENTGLIESQADEGFESGDDAVVRNSGTIRASDDGVQVGENAWIENGGLIESVTRGGDEADPQDGIDIDSGTIVNTGTIRSDDDAAIDYDASSTTSYIINSGTISGTTGVLVEKGLTGEAPNIAAQIVTNGGTIEGRAGLALDLGAGDDMLINTAAGILIGGADFGAGDDTADLAHAARGFGLFDGGAGDDELIFRVAFADLSVLSLKGGILSLALSGDMVLTATNWETFTFGDGSYSYDQIAALAPVPVPAAGLMTLGGMGALAFLRRRR